MSFDPDRIEYSFLEDFNVFEAVKQSRTNHPNEALNIKYPQIYNLNTAYEEAKLARKMTKEANEDLLAIKFDLVDLAFYKPNNNGQFITNLNKAMEKYITAYALMDSAAFCYYKDYFSDPAKQTESIKLIKPEYDLYAKNEYKDSLNLLKEIYIKAESIRLELGEHKDLIAKYSKGNTHVSEARVASYESRMAIMNFTNKNLKGKANRVVTEEESKELFDHFLKIVDVDIKSAREKGYDNTVSWFLSSVGIESNTLNCCVETAKENDSLNHKILELNASILGDNKISFTRRALPIRLNKPIPDNRIYNSIIDSWSSLSEKMGNIAKDYLKAGNLVFSNNALKTCHLKTILTSSVFLKTNRFASESEEEKGNLNWRNNTRDLIDLPYEIGQAILNQANIQAISGPASSSNSATSKFFASLSRSLMVEKMIQDEKSLETKMKIRFASLRDVKDAIFRVNNFVKTSFDLYNRADELYNNGDKLNLQQVKNIVFKGKEEFLPPNAVIPDNIKTRWMEDKDAIVNGPIAGHYLVNELVVNALMHRKNSNLMFKQSLGEKIENIATWGINSNSNAIIREIFNLKSPNVDGPDSRPIERSEIKEIAADAFKYIESQYNLSKKEFDAVQKQKDILR